MKDKKAKKLIIKKWWFWVIIVVILAAIFGNTDDSTQQETHLYDNAQVKDLMNGLGTKIIGEYSIIEANSDEVTVETLTDWYFNYVTKNDYNWCMIVYADKNDNSGVYSISGIVQKDVVFTKNENGDYSLSDINATSNAITYTPTNDNTLREFHMNDSEDIDKKTPQDISPDKFVSEVRTAIQGAINSNEETIADVVLKDGALCVTVDLSKANPEPLTIEDLAISRTGSITDAILELADYDSEWNTITVDFGDIGKITNSKDDIKENDFGCRYFPSENFTLE